jgi:hypothetical protein
MKYPLNARRILLNLQNHHCEPVPQLKEDKPFILYLLQIQQMNWIREELMTEVIIKMIYYLNEEIEYLDNFLSK